MKLFRLIFGLCIILFFFVLGVGFADKEYLSKNVVGIHIYADDRQKITQVNEFLAAVQCSEVQELCRLLSLQGIVAYLSPNKEYFDANNCSMGNFPYAPYATIIIDLGGRDQIEASYLKQIGTVPARFGCAKGLFATKVQEYYISFLSYLGKIQKRFNNTGFVLLK